MIVKIPMINLMKVMDEMLPSDEARWNMLHKLLEAQTSAGCLTTDEAEQKQDEALCPHCKNPLINGLCEPCNYPF